MVALGYRLFPPLSAAGGSSLPGDPLHISITHQARMENPIPEVHLPGDPRPDLPVSVDAQHLCDDDIGKGKGFLGVTTPVKYPLPFHGHYGS